MSAPSPDEFWAAVQKDVTEAGCWLWTGGIVKRVKYTRVRTDDGRELEPYQYAWELTNGRYDGPLYDVCPCPGCVNPEHWTDENHIIVEDDPAKYKPPRKGRKQTHCKRGHLLEGVNVYVKADGKRRCRSCMRLAKMKADIELRKTERRSMPDRETLIGDLQVDGVNEVARKYGVTEGTVRQWKKRYSL